MHKYRAWALAVAMAILLAACGGAPVASETAVEAGEPSSTELTAELVKTPEERRTKVAPGTVTFSLTGSMETGRQRHTATVLMDGTVLVTGGSSPTGQIGWQKRAQVYDSAEIYDPAAGAWSITGSMAQGRADHTATLLKDGRVLTVGMKGKKVGSEIFDPSTKSWSPAAEIGVARGEHTATFLQDGRVLVVGGRSATLQFLTSAETYDPATDSWSPAEDMAYERAHHTATLLSDGTVLVVGSDVTIKLVSSVEVFDPATGTWSPTGSLAEARAYHTATLLKDGRVLVVGSQVTTDKEKTSAEIYDPAAGTFSSAGETAETRGEHVATLLKDGRVLVVGGGYDPFAGQFKARTSAELYDPVAGAWSSAGNMSFGRYRLTASPLQDGRVLVTGGQQQEDVFEEAEIFSP